MYKNRYNRSCLESKKKKKKTRERPDEQIIHTEGGFFSATIRNVHAPRPARKCIFFARRLGKIDPSVLGFDFTASKEPIIKHTEPCSTSGMRGFSPGCVDFPKKSPPRKYIYLTHGGMPYKRNERGGSRSRAANSPTGVSSSQGGLRKSVRRARTRLSLVLLLFYRGRGYLPR